MTIVREFQYLENEEIYTRVVLEGILEAKTSVWIATANVKDLRIKEGKKYVSVIKKFRRLCEKGMEVRILHSGIPSELFLRDFRKYELYKQKNFSMRRCLRVHLKCVVIDGEHLFIGSPNLTGAGVGAKSANRRNFEIGILTDNSELIKNVSRLFVKIWEGKMCESCGRKTICYAPLEEPS